MSLARHLGQSPPDADVNFRSLVTFSAQAVIAAGCYAILSNADFLTIKRFLPETDAGLYAAVQTLGLLPMVGLSVFYNVMFSTVSFAHARGDETLTFFYRLLAAIALMGAVTVALTGLLARPLILLVFGARILPPNRSWSDTWRRWCSCSSWCSIHSTWRGAKLISSPGSPLGRLCLSPCW
jgi:O-antigen/teichoic acid export membrane protein